MTFTLFLILVLATARLAQAIAIDDITSGFRQWVLNKGWAWPYRLISCAVCAGFWLALIVVGVWFWATDWPGWPEAVIIAIAAAGGQSAVQTLLNKHGKMHMYD